MKKILFFLIQFTIVFSLCLAEETQNKPVENQKTFTVSFDKVDIDLNPIYSHTTTDSQVQSAVFEGLVTSHPYTLLPQPGIAYKWETDENRKVYRFFLRDDAKYSNGDKITATDFKDTWMFLLSLDNKISSFSFMLDIIKGAKDFRTKKNKDPNSVGIKVISDSILEVELEDSFSHFLQILSHSTFVPIHPKYRKERFLNEKNLISSGPFVLTKLSDDSMEFEKNPFYYDKASVDIDKLHIILLNEDEKDKNTTLFLAKKINWATNPGSFEINASIAQDLVVSNEFSSFYFYFVLKGPFANPKVREALTLLIPDTFKNKVDYPSNTFVPYIPFYPKLDFSYKQDIIRAKRLLEEVGYKEGKNIILDFLTYENFDFINVLKENWEKELKNIKVNIKKINSYKNFIEEQKNGNYSISFSSWVGDYLDPSSFLDLFLKDSSYNYSNFNSGEFDSLVKKGLKTNGLKERYELYSQAETILLKDYIVIPYAGNASYNLIDLENFDGWYKNVLDYHPFKYIKHKEQKLPFYVVQK